MSKIRCLDPHVADMIAAGEVVERPGSAVKELIENALDAGATAVTVEIQRGGMSYIRVTDNGCGMSPEDARTAFLRHATSKLRDEYGLEAIRTLGFRGEALAAIAAVSEVELLTREPGAAEGTSVTLEAGVVQDVSPVGCPEGTTIIVRSLFYNTPARLKFMKKDSAEAANVGSVVTRCAMSHPEVSVRYIKDGAEEFRTPGDGKVESCVYALLGRDFARNMLPVNSSAEGAQVQGFITTPANSRGNRGAQYFFVNGRFVKSQILQAALEQAYKNSLFTGRFPGCVLYLDVKFNEVDVNVHPAKTEVKFLNERKVFDAVYTAVKAALSGESTAPQIRLEEETAPAAPSAPAAPVKAPEPAPRREPAPVTPPKPQPAPTRTMREPLVFRQEPKVYNAPAEAPAAVSHRVTITEPVAPPHETEPAAPVPAAEKTPVAPIRPAVKPIPVPDPEEDELPSLLPPTEPERRLPPYRVIGEAFTEFILVESEGELIFIDKHAAHERMLFDRLKSRRFENMSQHMLTPAIAELSREEKALLLDNLPLLDELGFEIEDFGGSSLAVRRLPADVDMEDASALLEELCQNIRYGARPGNLGVRDELLATMACKAAIKAGRASDPREWIPVVEAVLSGAVRYCPHGRPVTMTLSRKQLDKNFKRI